MKKIRIGRHPNCDVVVQDPCVSRCDVTLIITDDGKCYCKDMNAKNGPLVNGKRITGAVLLSKDDIVRIGNTTIPWQKYIDASSK